MSKYVPRGELSPERLAHVRRKGKYYQHMNQMGYTFRCEGEELGRVRTHVLYLTRMGMSAGDIHDVSGVAEMTVRAIRDGNRTWIARRVANSLMMVQPELGDGAMRVPFLPTQRRVQALFADGYTYTYMGEPVGWRANALWRLAHGYGYRPGSFETQEYVYVRTAETVKGLYAKLAGQDPLAHGVPQKQVTYARRRARVLGFAPSHTWDWDTIENPEAFPEWTGHCGTPTGYRIHKRDAIPQCQPCLWALRDWQMGYFREDDQQ